MTVNTADTELADGKVYAFTYLGKLYIRKLRDLLDGGILVVSDNPTFPAEKLMPLTPNTSELLDVL